MNDFKVGEYIIYHNGEHYELGRIKSLRPDGAERRWKERKKNDKTCMYKFSKLSV